MSILDLDQRWDVIEFFQLANSIYSSPQPTIIFPPHIEKEISNKGGKFHVEGIESHSNQSQKPSTR